MLGGMVSLCSLAMCLRTISEYRKRSPQMRQCHWSWAKMYGRHSELFGSSLGSGILIIRSISRPQRYGPHSPKDDAATAPEVLKAPTLLVHLSGTGRRKDSNDLRECRLEAARYRVTDTHRWGAPMQNTITFEEGSAEAIARLREQDDAFCRRLRIAIERGSEFCPTTLNTKPCTSRPILNYTRTD